MAGCAVYPSGEKLFHQDHVGVRGIQNGGKIHLIPDETVPTFKHSVLNNEAFWHDMEICWVGERATLRADPGSG